MRGPDPPAPVEPFAMHSDTGLTRATCGSLMAARSPLYYQILAPKYLGLRCMHQSGCGVHGCLASCTAGNYSEGIAWDQR